MDPRSLDYAVTRYAVVFRQWEDRSPASGPYLPAFLAGWFASAIGVPEAQAMAWDVTTFRDSFRVGYREQRAAQTIYDREVPHGR